MRKILIAILMALVMVSGVMALNSPTPTGVVYTKTTPFTTSVQLDVGETSALVNDGIWHFMTCLLGVCTHDITIPLINGTNVTIEFAPLDTFPAGIIVPGSIIVDLLPPTTPVILATSGLGDNQITVSLTTPSTDVASGLASYNLYRDTLLVGPAVFPYVDSGLSTGLHSYEVEALDKVGNVGAKSVPSSATAQNNPPADPVISTVGCTRVPLTPDCVITLDYAEQVTVTIASGGYNIVLTSDPTGLVTWYPPIDPSIAARYSFTISAADTGIPPAVNADPFILDLGGASVPITIGDNMNTVTINNAYAVKGDAINNGYDWVVIGFDLTTTGSNAIYINLDDFMNAGVSVIDLAPDNVVGDPSDIYDSTATAFCSGDYNSATQDYDGTGPTLNVENAYTAGTIDCSAAGGSVYIKVGVPSGAPTGGATTTINFMN